MAQAATQTMPITGKTTKPKTANSAAAPAPVVQPNREKAIQILSKSIYRELRENGYEPKQIVSLATEIISLVTTDIGDATVVMLFLSARLNLDLRPKLLRELRPGTRVVSHWHDMGDWKPQETVIVSSGYERPVYLWTIPKR